MLWYPLKEPREVNGFIADLKATGIKKMLRAELTVMTPIAGRLYGSGLIVVNPPFTLEGELNVILPALAKLLEQGSGGSRVEWIRGES
jgi:23S rRNA (adenine2030-N6)-methyltransferase